MIRLLWKTERKRIIFCDFSSLLLKVQKFTTKNKKDSRLFVFGKGVCEQRKRFQTATNYLH